MSYETTNILPVGVSKRQAIQFAELLGFRRNGNYEHLGLPEMVSLIYYEEKDYKSWLPVELSVFDDKGSITVASYDDLGLDFYLEKKLVYMLVLRRPKGSERDFTKRYLNTLLP